MKVRDAAFIEPTAAERSRYEELGLWSSTETLSRLVARHAGERPEAEAAVDAYGTRLTYGDLDRRATALAVALSARDIGTGDVVGVQLPNRVEDSVAIAAIEKLGAVTVPLVTMFRDHEIAYVGKLTEMKALVVPGTYRRYRHDAMVLRIAEAVPSLRVLVSLSEEPPAPVESLAALIEEGEAAADDRFADPEIDPNAPAAILLTSGTEAAPKAVIHTNNTLISNSRALAQMLGMDERDAIFMPSPIGHGTGFGFGTRFAIFLGSKLVLQDIWEPRQAADTLVSEHCAYTHASTTFAQDLLELDDLAERDFSSLRFFVSGGAAIPPGFAAAIHEAMDGCSLLRLYGQTEAFMTTLNRPEDGPERLDGFDGRAVPGVEVAAWNDDGEPVAPGEVGEMVCNGPHRCRGFHGDSERTAAAIGADGWMRMGDLGKIDEAGFVSIVGRKKEVISRGGYKYSPREVEDLLVDHPRLLRAAVVRIPDRRLGEKACVCVIPRDDAELTLEDVTSYLRERGLAPFKLPESMRTFESFPTTASGKIQKFALEEELAAAAQE
jgi:acyl-CoA synthetase (AMP-forming)/AMP-acid ligase II